MMSGYDRVLDILRRNDPSELSLLASHLYEVGQALHSDGKFRQAARAYQDSLRVARRIPPPFAHHPRPEARLEQPQPQRHKPPSPSRVAATAAISAEERRCESGHRHRRTSPAEASVLAPTTPTNNAGGGAADPVREAPAAEASGLPPMPSGAAAAAAWWSDDVRAQVQCRLAAALRSAGDLRRSLDAYREVLRVARMRASAYVDSSAPNAGLVAREDEARCLVQIGLVQRDMGRTTDAIFTLTEALRVAVSMRGTEVHEDAARIMSELALIHHVDRRSLDVALFLYRKVLRICRSGAVLPMGGDGDPFVRDVLERTGAVLVEMGDVEAAEHVFQELETCRWAAMRWHEGGGSSGGGGRRGTRCAPAA